MGALEFGGDPHDGEQEPQVGRDGCLQQDLPAGQVLYLDVQGVDELLALGEFPGGLATVAEQGTGGGGQVLGDHREKLDDLGFDAFQRAVEFTAMPGHPQSVVARPPAGNGASRPGHAVRRGFYPTGAEVPRCPALAWVRNSVHRVKVAAMPCPARRAW